MNPKPSNHDDRPGGRIGVLISNLGTPSAPTPGAVRRFLRRFLADPRVVEAPRLSWWLIRQLFILPLRPYRSARSYRSIWAAEGAPMSAITARLVTALRNEVEQRSQAAISIETGMRYGDPSISAALDTLARHRCRRLVILPLFPQCSATTVGSAFDAVFTHLSRMRWVPAIRTVAGYADHQGYLQALADSVRKLWRTGGDCRRLLISFHGLPERYVERGDPYRDECLASATRLAALLELADDRWQTAFQSRFGREPWLQPATDRVLREWGQDGLDSVDVICPGFAIDCLETLEEIAIRGREIFVGSGGGRFRYIPALNDSRRHVTALADLIGSQLGGWS